mmetsp:Transcript_35492/g.98081  ORF Transcript_35492/g.98081 Transcript_35492/m.98081 type:complete len:250 (-) Transcript_35492:848-1597(-)
MVETFPKTVQGAPMSPYCGTAPSFSSELVSEGRRGQHPAPVLSQDRGAALPPETSLHPCSTVPRRERPRPQLRPWRRSRLRATREHPAARTAPSRRSGSVPPTSSCRGRPRAVPPKQQLLRGPCRRPARRRGSRWTAATWRCVPSHPAGSARRGDAGPRGRRPFGFWAGDSCWERQRGSRFQCAAAPCGSRTRGKPGRRPHPHRTRKACGRAARRRRPGRRRPGTTRSPRWAAHLSDPRSSAVSSASAP